MKILTFGVLLSTAMFSVGSNAAGKSSDLALEILRNLEVNTFHNSFRPQHYPEGTTVSQTRHHQFEKVAGAHDEYSATDEEKTWYYSLRVMRQSAEGVQVCFFDQSLQGSYRASSALWVRKGKSGHYRVVKELPATSACG